MNDLRPVKITIVTVTYRAMKLLPVTLQSVEDQNYPFVEHVIVDGKSEDGTMDLLQKYKERNEVAHQVHEIKILSESDEGLYDAMNKALKMATGDYVLFLNAGDRLHGKGTLRQVAEVAALDLNVLRGVEKGVNIQEGLAGVIYGNINVVDEVGHFVRERRLTPPEHLSWKSFRHGMVVCHQAFFARMDLARRNPYQLKYHFSADFDWCIRIMHEAAKMKIPLKNAHLIVADYLQGGLTIKNHRRSLMERFCIMSHHYGLLTTIFFHIFFVFRAMVKK
ncbi:MAG: glycosyltransferase family 2 protein [Parabacteroides sp.]|nr:glycosyltransferase family 2 protein [Parabacteroides sp.]